MGIATKRSSATPRKSLTSSPGSQSKSEPTTRTAGLTGLKSTVANLVRNNFCLLPPPSMRVHKLPTKGFVMPSDPYESSLRSTLHRQESMRSTQSRLTARSKTSARSRVTGRTLKSVYSIRSVKRVGSTPSIIVTQPTTRGRRTYRIHRGGLVYTPVAPKRNTNHQERYYRALANEVNSLVDDHQPATPSTSSDCVSESAATNSIIAADVTQPGTGLADKAANETPSGIGQQEAVLDIDFDRYKFVVDLMSSDEFAFDPSVKKVIDQPQISKQASPIDQSLDGTTRKHRQDAFMTLCGGTDTETGAEIDAEPAKPVARPKSYVRHSAQSASFILPADGGTFFDDREARKSYISASTARSSYKSRISSSGEQLQYLAYSPSVKLSASPPRKPDAVLASQDPWHKRVDSARTSSLRQLYDRIEKLEDGSDDVHSPIQPMESVSRPSSVILNALPATLTRPTTPARLVDVGKRPHVPQRHSMLDNGFPWLNPSVDSFFAEPSYAKRILSGDELKAMQKQERRKAALENPQKKDREWNRSKKVKKATRSEDMPLIDRMLAKLAF